MNSAPFPFYFTAISSEDTKSKPQICTWHSVKGAGIWSFKTSSTSISDWFPWNLWLLSVSYNWVPKTWSKEHQTHFSSPKGTQCSVTITKSGQEWRNTDCRSAHWSDPSFSFRGKHLTGEFILQDLPLQEARPPRVLFCDTPTGNNNLEWCDQCQAGSYYNPVQQSAQNIALMGSAIPGSL